MSVFAAIAFATFLFENDDFVAFYQRKHNFSIYFCAFHGRRADFYVAVSVNEKDFVESYGFALFHIAEMVDIQIFAGFGFVLQSLDFYDSVHLYFYAL